MNAYQAGLRVKVVWTIFCFSSTNSRSW